jgi:flagellar hook-length control protein FliK
MAADLSSLPVPMPASVSTPAQAKGASAAVSADSVGAATTNPDGGSNDFNSLLSQLLQSEPLDVSATPSNPAIAAATTTEETNDTLDDLSDALAQGDIPTNVIALVTDIANRNTSPTTVDQAALAAALANGHVRASGDARANANQWLARAQALLQSAQGKGSEAITRDAHWQNKLEQALQAQTLQAPVQEANSSDNSADPQNDADAKIDSLAAAYNQTQLKAESRTELQIQARVGTPMWREEVGAKISWMIERGIQHGTLRLSPDNMGPMEVRITTQDDKVSVWFGAAHADTRAALENALPRLREMFASQGLSLADAGVFREPPRDTPRSYASSAESGAVVTEDIAVAVRQSTGILDAYA